MNRLPILPTLFFVLLIVTAAESCTSSADCEDGKWCEDGECISFSWPGIPAGYQPRQVKRSENIWNIENPETWQLGLQVVIPEDV